MSKTFFDNYLNLHEIFNFEEIDKVIKNTTSSEDEKFELWQIVDEIIHHKILGCILDHLPTKFHKEFVKKFVDAPYDEKILEYLKGKIKKDVKIVIQEAVGLVVMELIDEIGIKRNNNLGTNEVKTN